MICRIWRGWTTPDKAAAYEAVVRGTVIPGIEARTIPEARAVLARFDARAAHAEVLDRRPQGEIVGDA